MTSEGVAILGIAVSAPRGAALLIGGRVVAAVQEADPSRFPLAAVRQCLQRSGTRPADLDFVALDTMPRAAFHRALIASRNAGFRRYRQQLQRWLDFDLHARRYVIAALGGRYRGPIAFVDSRIAANAAVEFHCASDEAAARVLWHRVLGHPGTTAPIEDPPQVQRTVHSTPDDEPGIPAPVRWLTAAALTVAYPLMLWRGTPSATNQSHRAGDYFVDAFGVTSPAPAARFLVACGNGAARLRGLTRASGRRAAGSEIPDEIYTLW